MYEIFEKLCDIKGITPYRFGKDMGVNSSTISTWKKKNSLAGPELAEKVCKYFGVTIDFLMGKTDIVVCPVCGFGDNPISERSSEEHDKFHKKFLEIKEKYPFFMNFSEANIEKKDRITEFRNPQKTINGKVEAFQKYLEAAFSIEICQNDYDIEHLDYEQFCRIEVSALESDWAISTELIDTLIEKYGVDKEYLLGNEQLLARVSKNDTLMKLLSYAEKLSPEMLNTLAIQVKALAEQNKKE